MSYGGPGGGLMVWHSEYAHCLWHQNPIVDTSSHSGSSTSILLPANDLGEQAVKDLSASVFSPTSPMGDLEEALGSAQPSPDNCGRALSLSLYLCLSLPTPSSLCPSSPPISSFCPLQISSQVPGRNALLGALYFWRQETNSTGLAAFCRLSCIFSSNNSNWKGTFLFWSSTSLGTFILPNKSSQEPSYPHSSQWGCTLESLGKHFF